MKQYWFDLALWYFPVSHVVAAWATAKVSYSRRNKATEAWGCGLETILIWCFVEHNYEALPLLLRKQGLRKCSFLKIILKPFHDRCNKCTKIKHAHISHALASMSDLPGGNCCWFSDPPPKTPKFVCIMTVWYLKLRWGQAAQNYLLCKAKHSNPILYISWHS